MWKNRRVFMPAIGCAGCMVRETCMLADFLGERSGLSSAPGVMATPGRMTVFTISCGVPPVGWMSLRMLFIFFKDTATTEIYTLSLRDACGLSRLNDLL